MWIRRTTTASLGLPGAIGPGRLDARAAVAPAGASGAHQVGARPSAGQLATALPAGPTAEALSSSTGANLKPGPPNLRGRGA
jgi:hypothetical protein